MGLHDQREIDGAGKAHNAIWYILPATAWCLAMVIKFIMRVVLSVCTILIGFVTGVLVVTRLRR